MSTAEWDRIKEHAACIAGTTAIREFVLRPEHAALRALIRQGMHNPAARALGLDAASFLRGALMGLLGPPGYPEGDRLELFVILVETAWAAIDWDEVARAVASAGPDHA